MAKSLTLVSEGERFELAISGTNSKIFYRRLDARAANRIRNENTTSKFVKRQMTEKVDDLNLQGDTLDYIIVGWENVPNPDTGEPAVCERAMKVRLPADTINELLDLSGAATAKRAEDTEDLG